MQVAGDQMRRAAARTEAAGDEVPVSQVHDAVAAGATAVP